MENFDYPLASRDTVQMGDFYNDGSGFCRLSYVGDKGVMVEVRVNGGFERQTIPFEDKGSLFRTLVPGVFYRKSGEELKAIAVGKDFVPSVFF